MLASVMHRFLWVSLGIALAVPQWLQASPYAQSFSLQSGLEHDTNSNMSVTSVKPVSLARLSPGYSLSYGGGPVSWEFNAAARLERTTNQDQRLNRNDPSLDFAWTREYLMGAFGWDFSYDQSSTRAAELDENGFSRASEGSIQTYRIALNWNHELTERTRFNFDGGHVRRNIDSGTSSGNRSSDLTLSMEYDWTERMLLTANMAWAESRQNESVTPSTATYTPSLGLSYELTELWGLTADVGITATESADSSSTAWNGGAGLSYEGERLSGSVEYSRRSSASAFGGFNETDRITGGLAYAYDDLIIVGLDLNISQQTAPNAPTSLDATFWAERELDEDLSLRFSWQHKQVDATAQKAFGNVWLLSLSYVMPEH